MSLFFLYVSHYAVHTRLVGKPSRIAKYAKKPNAGKGNRAKRNNVHLAAQLQGIDEGIGAIVAKLDALKLTDQTIVIFMSDNGGESRVTSNAPLRAGKSTLYEGGIRGPLIVRWPAVVAPGTTCEKIVSNMDFFPTFAEILRRKTDETAMLDGVSILDLWNNADSAFERDTLYWHYPLTKPHFLGGFSSGAVRSGAWKLVEHFTTGKIELFNLQDDVGERHDLSASRPEKAEAMAGKLKSWRNRIGATVVKHASGQS